MSDLEMDDLEKVTQIIQVMIDLDKILCPACNRYEDCQGSKDWECLLSTAIKARKMRG